MDAVRGGRKGRYSREVRHTHRIPFLGGRHGSIHLTLEWSSFPISSAVCLSLRIESDIIVTSLIPNSPTDPGRKTPSNARPCICTRCPLEIRKTSRRTRLRGPRSRNQLLRRPKLEPTRHLPLENAPGIILATHIPQPLLDLRSIPADDILAAIRVVQVLVRVVQTRFVLDAGFLFDVVEEPDRGVLRQGVVGRVVPGGGQEAVYEGAVGGWGEAEGVAAQGPGARCYEWGDGLDGEGPLDSGDGFYEGDGGVPEGVDAVEEGAGVFEGGGAIELALDMLVIWLDVDENFGRGKEGESIGMTYRKPSGEKAPCSVVKSVTLLTRIVWPN